jgi:hypothetical protein
LESENSDRYKKALALLDSGNQLGPLVAYDTVLALGFQSRDFHGDPQVFECVGGLESVTAGTVRMRYYQNGNFSKPLVDDFHVVESLPGGYDIILPTEEMLDDPDVTPLVAATVAPANPPDAGELYPFNAQVNIQY